MTSRLQSLVADVAAARERFIAVLGDPTPDAAMFRTQPDSWSLTEHAEHVVLVERGVTHGLWKALDGVRRGAPVWTGTPIHPGRSIEDVVARTWRAQEAAPPIAVPSWGGPLGYWVAALRGNQVGLDALGAELEATAAAGIALETVIYVQPVSGPLDAWQRLEFVRWHLDRHTEHVRRVRGDARFPASQPLG